jgi:hypothetical protein
VAAMLQWQVLKLCNCAKVQLQAKLIQASHGPLQDVQGVCSIGAFGQLGSWTIGCLGLLGSFNSEYFSQATTCYTSKILFLAQIFYTASWDQKNTKLGTKKKNFPNKISRARPQIS